MMMMMMMMIMNKIPTAPKTIFNPFYSDIRICKTFIL